MLPRKATGTVYCPLMARAVTESALMAALSFLLYVASTVPLLGAICVFLCPVPITIVGVRHGTRRAALSCACATVLVFALAGGFTAAYLFMASFGIFGLASGWMLTREGSPGRALGLATMAVTLVLAPTIYLAGMGMGLGDSLAEAQKMMFSMLDAQAALFNDPSFTAALPKLKDFLATLMVFPLMGFVVSSLTGLYLNHLVTHKVFERMGFAVRPPPNPYHLRMAPWAPLLLVLCWIRYGAVGGANRTMEASFFLNVALVGVYIAWFSGIAALARLWSPKQELPVSRYLLLVFVGIFFGWLPVLLGCFDAFQPPAESAVNPAPVV